MDDLQINEIWQITIWAIKEKAEKSLKEFGIPIIRGSVSGHGCCFVSIISAELSDYKNLFSEGSICVIHMEELKISENEQDKKIYKSIKVYIRLGHSNTWLYFGFEIPEVDDDEEFLDEETDFDDELEQEAFISISLQVAQAHGFSNLKNKAQRLEFTKSTLPKLYPEAISDYTTREIASRAESYYELGILPSQVKILSKEGKLISIIAKELGISKQRAERALACEIPDFISELL